jgi:hypothetical protein
MVNVFFMLLVLEIRPRFGLSTAEAIDNEWQLIRDGFPELPFRLTQYDDVFPFANNEGDEIFENPLQTYYRELEEDNMRMNDYYCLSSEPSSLRSSQSQSIPSDWLQDCSVRTEDVPLSEVKFMQNILIITNEIG